MSECEVGGGCDSCREECGERLSPDNLAAKPHELSDIKKVFGVVSGKGGVGKSLVAAVLAVLMKRRGHSAAILDADITGPSIPRAFGLFRRAGMNELGLYPVMTKTGIEVMSLNLLIENESDPVIWRGPVIGGTVKQFWTDVIWGEVDFMFIDMPPGTGDVPLTVFQSLKLDGVVVVASPQELVSMIVEKALNMARMMNIPILGLVENMSYLKCPDCGREILPFGPSRAEETALRHGLKNVWRIPLDSSIAEACDRGEVESLGGEWLEGLAAELENQAAAR
ncbi:MAG: Mrp/NBP35 family ATP-binding protein [Candidatus Adiutrix sp.]|jgi:Mrp family chromosome partitioning ATPase|nr:Mrp/NBP35 family ATP-binding protein [Candidatus Adiutrix sp.]